MMADIDRSGLTDHEILLEVRKDVKDLLLKQERQNGRLDSACRTVDSLTNRFWGLLVGLVVVAIGVIVDLAMRAE